MHISTKLGGALGGLLAGGIRVVKLKKVPSDTSILKKLGLVARDTFIGGATGAATGEFLARKTRVELYSQQALHKINPKYAPNGFPHYNNGALKSGEISINAGNQFPIGVRANGKVSTDDFNFPTQFKDVPFLTNHRSTNPTFILNTNQQGETVLHSLHLGSNHFESVALRNSSRHVTMVGGKQLTQEMRDLLTAGLLSDPKHINPFSIGYNNPFTDKLKFTNMVEVPFTNLSSSEQATIQARKMQGLVQGDSLVREKGQGIWPTISRNDLAGGLKEWAARQQQATKDVTSGKTLQLGLTSKKLDGSLENRKALLEQILRMDADGTLAERLRRGAVVVEMDPENPTIRHIRILNRGILSP